MKYLFVLRILEKIFQLFEYEEVEREVEKAGFLIHNSSIARIKKI